MTHLRRAIWILLTIMTVLSATSLTVWAEKDTTRLIRSDVVVTTEMPDSEASEEALALAEGATDYTLLVQATAWPESPYRYILTLTNLTPWPMSSLYVLDRYIPNDPAKSELMHDWFPTRLEPGASQSVVFSYPEGPLDDACHQIEISMADGIGTVLMDCSQRGATTVWNVSMNDQMATYLAEPELTAAESTGRSKVGIHVTRNSDPEIMNFVSSAHPSVVVGVGDLGWFKDVKAASPDTITLGRLEEGDQSFDGDPIQRARDFVAANTETYLANPAVDYWMGWNEPVFDNTSQMEWYAQFESERTRAMAELGLKTAIGNFSAGTPEADQFQAFMPAIAVAKDLGGVLAVHEYSAPNLQDGVGAGIPGLKATGDSGALTLRYRFWYDYYLKPNDLVIPLVVTEAGIDGGVLRMNDVNLFGWRDFDRSLPDEVQAQVKTTNESYLDQLSWYDDQLRRDSYVLGFAIFNVGDPDGRWASFDITDMLPDLGQMVLNKDIP